MASTLRDPPQFLAPGLLRSPGLTVLNHSLNPLILNKWLNELTCLSDVGFDLWVGQQPNQMKIGIVADGDRMLALIRLADLESI